MYNLTYGFYGVQGTTYVPKLLAVDNTIINNAVVVASFAREDYFGFTLSMPDSYQGFVLFQGDDNSDGAIFAINPQETEYSDVKTSLVRGTGTGSVDFPVIVRSRENVPLSNVEVWITTDALGVNIIAGVMMTDANGSTHFLLNSGDYYLWRRHNTYTFINPQRITV